MPTTASGAALTRARPPFWVIVAITMSGIMTNTMVTAGLPDILEGVGASQDQAGILIAVGSLPGIVLAALIGLLSDKWGRRELLIPLLLVFSLVGAAGALATNLPQLLAIRFVQGSASAGLINLGAVLIADHWPGDQRARMLGINAGILTTCLSVFPFLGGLLVEWWGWRAPFVAYLVVLGPTFVAWRRLPRSVKRDVSIAEQFAEVTPYLRRRDTIALLLSTSTLFLLIFGMMITVMPLHANDAFGLGPSQRGLILGMPAIGSTIAAFSIARVRARIGPRRVAIAIGILFTAALSLISVATAIPVLIVGAILFGLGEGASFPTFQDRLASLVPDQVRGTMMASQVSAARVGQVIGPVLAGSLVVTEGARTTFAIGAGIAAFVLAPLALRALRISPDGRQSSPEPEAS
jgi:ACDE family multidrug resistance protein